MPYRKGPPMNWREQANWRGPPRHALAPGPADDARADFFAAIPQGASPPRGDCPVCRHAFRARQCIGPNPAAVDQGRNRGAFGKGAEHRLVVGLSLVAQPSVRMPVEVNPEWSKRLTALADRIAEVEVRVKQAEQISGRVVIGGGELRYLVVIWRVSSAMCSGAVSTGCLKRTSEMLNFAAPNFAEDGRQRCYRRGF